MTDEAYNKYLEAYDRILDLIVELHNSHQLFKSIRSENSKKSVRSKAIKLAKEIKALPILASKAYIERRANIKGRKIQKREELLANRRKFERRQNNRHRFNIP